MQFLSRLIGLNLIVILVVAFLGMSGQITIYWDIPGVVIVVGLLVGGMLLSFRPGQIGEAVALAVAGDSARPVSPQRRRAGAAVFGRAYQLAWGAGLLATLFGLIAMLADLSDPAAIGVGMSVALLTTAYGALLAEFLFAPLQQSVLNHPLIDEPAEHLGADAEPIAGGAPSGLWRGVAVVALLVAIFFVPIVSFSEIKKEDQLRPDEEARYLRYLYGEDAAESPAARERLGDVD